LFSAFGLSSNKIITEIFPNWYRESIDMVEALKGPRHVHSLSRSEAAERLRTRVMAARPVVASAFQQIGRSGFYLGVRHGKDVISYRVKTDDTPTSVWEAAVAFAGQNKLVISPGQSAADLVSRHEKAEPRFGEEVSIYLDKVAGPIAAARDEISKMPARYLDTIGFSHHWLDGSSETSFDCLARAFSDLGIVREDLHGLDWKNRKNAIRSIRRRVFINSPEIANEVLQAEKIFADRQPLTPDVLTRLNDTRLKLLGLLLNDDNLRDWHLSGITGATAFRSRRDAIEKTFPFVKDTCFNPREPLFRLIRGKVFERHPDGVFLAEIFRQLTSPGYAEVKGQDVARAQQLLSFEQQKEIEALGVSHHLCDTLRPKPTLLELFARAFAVFNLDSAVHSPSVDHQPLETQPADKLSVNERRLINSIIAKISLRHPQGRSLSAIFGKLSRRVALLENERIKATKLLHTVQSSDLRKWGVKLPLWVIKSKMRVSDLLILAFPDLAASQKTSSPPPEAKPASPPALDWSSDWSAARIIRGRCFDLDLGLREEVAAMERILATSREHVASGRLARLQRRLNALVTTYNLSTGGAVGFEGTKYSIDLTATAVLAFPMLDLPVFKEIAARQAEFIGTFPGKYAIMIPSLLRRSHGEVIDPEIYDRVFDDLVLDREQTIRSLNSELLALYQRRQAKPTRDQVQLSSSLVFKHSVYIFNVLFGLSCDEYIGSAQFAELLPSKKR
jgi:hypothetical protein